MKYIKYDNCFTWIDDVEKELVIADSLEAQDLSRKLDRFASELNPYLKRIQEVLGQGYG